jgi:tetratricopeptide (TPR) repeat protein
MGIIASPTGRTRYAEENVVHFVIPSEARNLSSIEAQEKRDSSAWSIHRFTVNAHRERNDKILSFSATCKGRRFDTRAVKYALMVALVFMAPCRNSAAQTTTDATIHSIQIHLKMYPRDFKSYDALGASYIQKGRETADASYYELANDALNKSLDLVSTGPDAASAKTHMAEVAMSEHQFEEALSWAQSALALGSGDPSPWAIVGDALTDMGEYQRADDAYARLRDPLHPEDDANGLAYERNTRVAYMRFLKGDAPGAIELMRAAIAVSINLHLPAENVAWSQYQLGEICFKSGDLIGAEQAYTAGLAIDPNSYRNLAGLGEVLTARERYPEAIALYQKAIAVVPYPAFAAALYDLDVRVGRPDDAHKQLELLEFIGTLNPLNERLFYRELALFYADHNLKLKESVELAKKELEVRHDIYTWDILAWVLFKNGSVPEAAEAVDKALAIGTADALLDFHAGMIELQLGRSERARTLFEQAVTLNPQFHLVYADQARERLRQLADSETRMGRASASSVRGSKLGAFLQ